VKIVIAISIGLIACAAMLTACGGPSAEQREAARKVDARLLGGEVRKRERQNQAAEADALAVTCQSEIGDLMDSLDELNSRLDIGLTYADYGDQLGDANVAYDQVPAAELSGGCLDSAAKLEAALNAYIRAYNKWKTCIDDYDCNTDSIEPALQAAWSKASSNLDRAHSLYDGVGDETTVSVGEWTMQVPGTSDTAATTVYGAARDVICGDEDLPPAAKEACAKFETALDGGVLDDERGDFDEAVADLNIALGLKAAEDK